MKTKLKLLVVAVASCALPALAGAADAAENWKKDCQKCHAADGSGSGPMGRRLKLKDYTDPAVQAELTDGAIIATIKEGVKNESTGKMTMPAYGDKYSEEEIQALKDFIRGLVKS